MGDATGQNMEALPVASEEIPRVESKEPSIGQSDAASVTSQSEQQSQAGSVADNDDVSQGTAPADEGNVSEGGDVPGGDDEEEKGGEEEERDPPSAPESKRQSTASKVTSHGDEEEEEGEEKEPDHASAAGSKRQSTTSKVTNPDGEADDEEEADGGEKEPDKAGAAEPAEPQPSETPKGDPNGSTQSEPAEPQPSETPKGDPNGSTQSDKENKNGDEGDGIVGPPMSYDWRHTNLALFGSDIDRAVKKESAVTEKAWQGAGTKTGLKIWRIVNFQVEHWPKGQYGKFYNGDSYIVLHTYSRPGRQDFNYNLHFWIGSKSTQDEYGTVAYKTVELDTFLDERPVQHREVMGRESELFKSYFSKLIFLEGGAPSGFNEVSHDSPDFKKRLLHFHGTSKGITIRERRLSFKSLDSSDVFLLDMGQKIYVWHGSTANKDERYKAVQVLQELKSERKGQLTWEVLEECGASPPATIKSHPFYVALSEGLKQEYHEEHIETDTDYTPSLFRMSAGSSLQSLSFDLLQQGKLEKDKLDSSDVILLDSGSSLHVWIGTGASAHEKKNAMTYAHKYLQSTKHPLVPVSCFTAGNEPDDFWTWLS